jgi:hypothetical protein
MQFPPRRDVVVDQKQIVKDSWLDWFTQTTQTVNFISPTWGGNQGDSDLNLSTSLAPWPGFLVLQFSTALTANRTITLPVAPVNSLLVVTRSATGASTLNVGGIKSLAAGQWVVLVSNGTVWYELMFGSL